MAMAQWIGEMAKGQSFANVPPVDMATAALPDVVRSRNRLGVDQLCKGPTTHAVPPVSFSASVRMLP